jgi:thiol-disulfide isomerase/thioredoxin
MKNFLALMIMSLLFIGCKHSSKNNASRTSFDRGNAVFSVHITNPNQAIVKLKSYGIYKELDLDESGKLTDSLSGISESYYMFSDKRNGAGFYIKPGAHVHVDVDTKSFLNLIKFSGDLANENNYLKEYFILGRDMDRINSVQHLAFQDEPTFKKELNQVRDARLKLLNDYDAKTPLDKHFKFLEENRIKYEWLNRMETYEVYRRYALEDSTFVVSKDFYDFRKDVDKENRDLIIVPSYHYYLENIYQREANEMTEKAQGDVYVNFLKAVGSKVKDSVIKERLLYSYAQQNLSKTGDIENFFKTFKKNSLDSIHILNIRKSYIEINRLNPGKPAPDFSLVDENGKKVSLKDFKGKYVYIDVWATWCRPCIAEMPHLEQLKEKYKDAPIVFVGVNVNSYKGDWAAYLKNNRVAGVKLYAGENSAFAEDYQVYSVPKSILINPYGVISTASAPRPSENELISLLFDRIKEKFKQE